jgi:hypothetical protein
MSSSSTNDSDSDSSTDDESSIERDECNSRKRRRLLALVSGYIFIKRNQRRQLYIPLLRAKKKKRKRRDPDVLLQESLDDGMFQREYRMSYESFCKLFDELRDGLRLSPRNSRDDAILPKTKLMMTIRFLAGASYIDILRVHGVSRQAVYKHVKIVIGLIADNARIGAVEWPETSEACAQFALQWAGKSGPSAFRGLHQTCIAALDGILFQTKAPTKKETKRPNDYRSGHKKQIGLNVQAICDAMLRFMSLSCRCPGKTNDWMAYLRAEMSTQVDNLPSSYYILGDAAYVNSEHLLVPYPGTNLNQREDAYNFYLSQLRIRIEQAFALLVGRWGIFWRPLQVPLRHQPTLILATCKLHNFCIDEREACGLPAYPNGDPAPDHCRVGVDGLFIQRDVWRTLFQRQSRTDNRTVRDRVADLIQEFNLARPAHNRMRNSRR